MEFFAGSGHLTTAVKRLGIPSALPDDLASGGTDFLDNEAVDKLKHGMKATWRGGKIGAALCTSVRYFLQGARS